MGYYFANAMEPEEPAVIAYCTECKGELYAGEEYITDDGGHMFCRECFEAEMAALPLWVKAQLMGYEVRGGALCRR